MKNIIKIVALFAVLISVIMWTSCNKSNTPTPTNKDNGVSQFRDDPDDPPTDPNCIQFHDGCQPEFVEHISKTIKVMSNPDCYADVEYDVWRCFNYPILHYYFNNFSAYPNEDLCPSVNQYWADLIANNEWDKLQTEVLKFLYKAQQAAEVDYFTNEYYPYLIPDCFDDETILYSDFYVNTCWKLFWRIIEINGIPSGDIRRIKCGTGCCQRESNWCYNPITGKLQQTVFAAEKVGDCQGVLDPVPEGYHPLPAPFDKCERDCDFYEP